MTVEIQQRDLDLLLGLFVARLMEQRHVSSLFFENRQEAAKKRLQKLKTEGLIRERPRQAYEPALLFLTKKGYRELLDRGLLANFPALSLLAFDKRMQVSPLTIRHEIAVVDVMVTMLAAIRKLPRFTVTEFLTWPALIEFAATRKAQGGYGKTEVTIKPDGFCRFREQLESGAGEYSAFLELDRSTETLDTLALRAEAYLNHYQTGGFAARFGASRERFKEFPFRVLFVFKNAERRNNIAQRLLQNYPPIFTLAWLTTMKELTNDPLGPIWVRPKDFQDAMEKAPSEFKNQSSFKGYRRITERESWVESRIQKHPFFDADQAVG